MLPEDIRKRLFMCLLHEKRITQLQILDEVNRLIEAARLKLPAGAETLA